MTWFGRVEHHRSLITLCPGPSPKQAHQKISASPTKATTDFDRLHEISNRNFVDAPSVGRGPQETLSRMDLQIKYGRVGKPVLKDLPIPSTIGGMPHTDIRSYIDVVRRPPIDGEGIVLDVEQIRRRRAASGVPVMAVEPPDS